MHVVEQNLFLITLFPLIGSFLAFVVGRRRGDLGGWIATAAAFCSFLCVVNYVRALGAEQVFEQTLFTWFSVPTTGTQLGLPLGALGSSMTVPFAFRFDSLTAVMCLVITGVGTLIHLYSIAYMHEDPSPHRFFSYLNLFMFSMLTLVLGGNLVVMFVGWEGVGLCSYLLIGFWFKNMSYAEAGMKAFVVNRIGDVGVLIAMMLLFLFFGTVDFSQLSAVIPSLESSPTLIGYSVLSLIAIGLFVGATGKSAQIPLFVWLPDAMAGPTPVSALIHAATMVTAGVYMMARTHVIFDAAPEVMVIVAVISVLTAFVAATTALAQNDIKKVLAYSTVSQLGFMFMAAAAGAYWVALFHVVTHAFFKACLFLGAGSVIHGCHHEQDMRHMGGLLKKMPITAITYGISTLAIAGIAPFAGYYSKHAILAALEHPAWHLPVWTQLTEIIPPIATLTAFLTSFYMTRSFGMTFMGSYRGHAHPHESPWKMTLPLVILSALALLSGGWLAHHLPEYVEHVLPRAHAHAADPFVVALAHSWVGILGVGLGLLFYGGSPVLAWIPGVVFKRSGLLGRLFERKYYFDELYGAIVVRPLRMVATALFRIIDRIIIDGAVNGVGDLVVLGGQVVRLTQSGYFRLYALCLFMGALFLITFYMAL